jgi:Toprim-like
VSSTTATEMLTVHEAQLVDPRQSGGRIRAVCHLHGGDHQHSLSIATGGDAAGYGYCHSCHACVFVPELAPPGVRGPGAGPHVRPRRVSAEAMLRPVRRMAASDPTPAAWQRDELQTLHRLAERMCARLADDRARAYLAARGIPWDVAAAAGVGYIPADARLSGVLAKWRDRLVFPLSSPAGLGYAGRSLHGWEPGMDENAHKALLDADPAGPRRWEKTYPAGWLGFGDLAAAEYAVIVEGPVDALALLAAAPSLIGDVPIVPIVALVGTAARAEWIPANIAGVVLALDGDAAGCERAQTLRHELRAAGLAVTICAPAAEDGRGKDWAERWRLAGHEGVWSVFEALDVVAIAA